MKTTNLGYFQFGNKVYDSTEFVAEPRDTPNSGGKFKTQYGFGLVGHRIHDKSEKFSLRQTSVLSGAGITISITSISGALVGKIRSDVGGCIIQSLEFTNDEHGCADFILKLSELPNFPLLPFSMIAVRIGETNYDWYSGEISYPDDLGTQRDFFEYRGFGQRNILKTLKAFTTYGSGADIGEIVLDLVQTWIVPYSAINYNPSKIDGTTGVIIANDIQLGKFAIEDVLNTLSSMCSFYWGVDGNRDFFFRAKESSTTIKTYFAGYNIEDFNPKLNLDTVKNAIMVQRQQGLGSGGAGWEIAGLFNDTASIHKYGKRELNYQIPGYFQDDDAAIVGNALLAAFKEPQLSAAVKGFRLKDGDDFKELGLYRFILPFQEYSKSLNSVDDASEWTVMNATGNDLSVTDETVFFVDGQRSAKFECLYGLNSFATLPISTNQFVERIRFYIRASRAGAYLSAGVGQVNYFENTVKINIPVANTFFLFDWDVSGLALRKLSQFGIRVDDDDDLIFYIDRIEALLRGNPFYKLLLARAKYVLTPDRQAIDCEFGPLPPKMENYVAGLIQVSSELKFTGEIR